MSHAKKRFLVAQAVTLSRTHVEQPKRQLNAAQTATQAMNNKTLDHLLITLTVLFDLGFVATAVVVAYWVRFESGWTPEVLALHKGGTPPLDDYFRLIPLMAIIWLMTLKALKLYRPENNATLSAFWALCKAAGIALIATLAALFFIFHHDAYSRWVMLLASGFSLVWLFLGRLVLYRFRQAIHAKGSVSSASQSFVI